MISIQVVCCKLDTDAAKMAKPDSVSQQKQQQQPMHPASVVSVTALGIDCGFQSFVCIVKSMPHHQELCFSWGLKYQNCALYVRLLQSFVVAFAIYIVDSLARRLRFCWAIVKRP